MTRAFLRVTVVPVLLGLVGVATLLAIANGWSYDLVLAASLIFTIAYLAACERLIPLNAAWLATADEVSPDLVYTITTSLLSAVGTFVALSAALHVRDWVGLELSLWQHIPFVWAFVLGSLLGELLSYVYHRVSHVAAAGSAASMFLWRVHAIHHIPPKINCLKTSWMHPLNTFGNAFAKIFPVLLLGLNRDVVFAIGMSGLAISYISHADIDARTGPLDYVIATPRVHHFHHSVKREEAQNYANNFPFWDLVLGTYFNARRRVAEVGVHATPETDYPGLRRLWQQVTFPFRGRTDREARA